MKTKQKNETGKTEKLPVEKKRGMLEEKTEANKKIVSACLADGPAGKENGYKQPDYNTSACLND